MLTLNAVCCGEGSKGVGHVLPSLVIAQHLDLLPGLVLSVRLVCFEGLECTILGLQGDHNVEAGVVITEPTPDE